MKTRSYLLITIFSLLTVLFVSCEKEPSVDPKDTEDSTVVVLHSHAVRISNSGGGTSSPSGYIRVNDSENLTINFTPYPGHKIDSAYVNDTLVPTKDNALVFENISYDYTIRPIFKMTEQTRLLTQKPWATFYCTWRGVKTDYYDYSDYIYGEDSVLFSIDKYYPFDPHSTYDPEHAKLETFNKAGVKIGDYTYELKGDSIIYPDKVNNGKIIELSENSLIIEGRSVWVRQSEANPDSVIFVDSIVGVITYKHPDSY